MIEILIDRDEEWPVYTAIAAENTQGNGWWSGTLKATVSEAEYSRIMRAQDEYDWAQNRLAEIWKENQ